MAKLPYPHPTSEKVSVRMRANPRCDTKPEVALRSALHALGLRFRKDHPIRLGSGRIVRPDVVFTRAKLAVFVDGCFWHCCPQHGVIPRVNLAYWRPKLARNVARDAAVSAALEQAGWIVIRAWEHDEPARVAADVALALAS